VTTEATPPASARSPQHLLDFARLWVGIRRRRRLWLTIGVLGFVAGGMLTVLMPPPPTATVRILVVHEGDGPAAGGSLILTDVALLTTTRTAAAALEKVGSAEQPEEFVKEYQVVSLTNNVLEVTVKGPNGPEATARAKALAEVFIADHIARIQNSAKAETAAITGQRDQVQKELDGVNSQISGAEAAAAEQNGDATPPDNAAGLDSLYARRAELSDQASQLTQQAQQASLGAPKVAEGTQIIDAPRANRASMKLTAATNTGIGLVLGLVVGIALAAVAGVVRDKPVLRKDIAENLGASVIAQLPGKRRGLYRLLPNKKAERERRRVAATLVRLARDGAGPVSVLELGAAPLATALATDVAAELAADRPVVLVTNLDRAPEAPSDTGHPVRVIGTDDTSAPVAGEARIGIGTVSPGTTWTDLTHLGAETLLVVRAGYANTTWLHTVARQLADVGVPVAGVVLVDPDPRDKTDGTLWDGLHTALRGRTTHASKVNGVAKPTNGVTRPAPTATPAATPAQAKTPAKAAPGADLPTKRLAPVTPPAVHDLPTTRFAPVRQENDSQRRTQG
jgi:capsular polysaccharide biosynthesis protein